MRLLDHKNTLKMVELYEGNLHIYIVFDYLEGGELYQKIVEN